MQTETSQEQNQLIIKHQGLYEIFKKGYITFKEYQEKKVKISNVIV